MAKSIKFDSVETRLIVVLLFLTVLPTISVGWIAHNLLYENIRSERIGDVGRIADAKHSQLVMMLMRANERAKLFLENLGAQCGANAAKLDRDCASKLIRSYLSAENAMGATLHHKGSNDLKIGAYAPGHSTDLKFQTGQLATFSGTGPANNRSYVISVAEQSARLQLEVSYPSSNLQPIFDHTAALGESGETFLTDAEGYFVTQGRYPSTQGHSHPIDARPMQSCLRGRDAEVLDLDYRGAKIIHGFRLVPEFGSVCIMAHIDQAEAFAPLLALERESFVAMAIFLLLAFVAARHMAGKIAQPMVNLTKTARSIAQGDYTAKADVTGLGEIADLATAFNSMTQQLTAANAQLEQRSAELAHQRSFVRLVIDSDPNLIFVKDAAGRFLLANAAMAQSHGLAIHEVTGKHASYFTNNPERVAAYDRVHREVLETRREQESIEPARLADGQNHWFRTRRIPLLQGDGSTGVLTIAMDITAHKLAEQKLQDINRALRLLSECNALLLNAETEEHLLAEVCAVLVKTGGYSIAWVGFAEHDKDKEVRPVAKYGFEEVYPANAGIGWADTEWAHGPAGSVIRKGVTQINQNAFSNSQMSPWRDAALEQGYRSSISLPLKDGEKTFGVLSLYTAQTDTFNANEIELLEDIADKLAFGVAMQRLRVRHLHSVEALQQSEEKFRLLVEHLPQRIFVKDVNSTYLSCNKHYAQDRGITQNDIAGKTDFDFHPQALAEKYREDDKHVMASGKMKELVDEHILNGEQRFVHIIKVPFKGQEGDTLGVLGMYWDDTERIQAENRLRRSEQNLAEAQRMAHLGSWEFDLCTNLLTWSDESYRIFEIDPDGFGASYESFLDTVHPDDRELVNNAYTESTRNNTPYDIVHRLLMKDGRVKFVHEKCETFYSEDGTPLRSVGTTHDITERMAAEASRNQLSEAIKHSGEAIALADQNNRFVYINPAFSRLLGYSLEEVSGKSVDDVIGVESTSTQPDQVRMAAEQHGMFRGETLRRTKDGRIIPVLLTVSCVRDEHGRSTGYVANLFDLTERYQAEEELRCQKLFMGQVIDTDPNLIFVKDAAGKCLLVNRAMASHYGLTTQEMTGKHIQDVNPKREEVLAILEADRKVIESGRELTDTTASVRPNGKPQWFLTIKRPLVQADGTVAVLGIAVDITEQKLAEIKLANSYLELQRLSTHLENLREDERAKIARDLHDEMGAQLVALKMRVAWLASKLPAGIPRLAEEAEQISGLVADAIRAMHQIVTQLRPNLQEGFGFAATIEDYVNKFSQRTGIKCTLVFPEEELALEANQRVSLFRILQESLSNVTKYAQASHVKVVLAYRGKSLSLVVKDNGIGFNPAAHKEQCFGLLGIRERALMMGGKARIRSTPGKGTRVSVTIPDFGLSEPA